MASSNGNARWVPPPGRHKVDVGGSLKRALRARKGMPATTNKNMPVSDYYHFRYNFKPESVDTSKPGVVEVKRGKEATTVQVERPSLQSEDVHIFRGNEEPSKEIECVLIYDEETNTFTLEKLDSTLSLTHEGKGKSKARIPSASPLPNTPSPAASISKIDPEEEVERELLNALGSTDTETMRPPPPPPSIDVEDFEELLEQTIAPSKPAPKPRRASNAPTGKSKGKKAAAAVTATASTTAAPATPALPRSVSTTPAPTATTSSAPTKKRPGLKGSTPAVSTSSTPPPPRAAAPTGKAAASASTPRVAAAAAPKSKPPAPAPPVTTEPDDVEVFEFDFGKPAKQTRVPAAKVAKVAKAAASPTEGLALPFSGGSAAFMPGPPPSSSSSSSAVQQQQQLQQDDDDDDDDPDGWDVVAGAGADESPLAVVASPEIPLDASSFGAVGPTGEFIDQFAADLDQQLLEGLEEDDGEAEDADDDMFGDNEYEQATQAQAAAAAKGKPMSLNQFAGGGETGLDDQDDDDDYSSSEESDE